MLRGAVVPFHMLSAREFLSCGNFTKGCDVANICATARLRQRNAHMAAAQLGESLDADITGIGELLEVLAQNRVGDIEETAKVREFSPLNRSQAGTDAQPQWSVD